MDIHEQIVKWQLEGGVQLFRKIQLPEHAIGIDFGCGYGEYSVSLALSRADITVYSVDKNKKMLQIIQEKMNRYSIANIRLTQADGSLTMAFPNEFSDIILMYDLIHGNTQDKLPIRFSLFEEAHRVLKPMGILSIAPFECEYLRDTIGNRKKYTRNKLISEVEKFGFRYIESMEGAIHFDYYHSSYHWKKLNGDMAFDYLEVGPVMNFQRL